MQLFRLRIIRIIQIYFNINKFDHFVSLSQIYILLNTLEDSFFIHFHDRINTYCWYASVMYSFFWNFITPKYCISYMIKCFDFISLCISHYKQAYYEILCLMSLYFCCRCHYILSIHYHLQLQKTYFFYNYQLIKLKLRFVYPLV